MWQCIHIITRLELGGAQLATLFQVAHSRFGAGPNHLLFGPGGMLDEKAQALPGVQSWPVPALGRALSPLDDVVAVAQMIGILRTIRRQAGGGRLLVHTHSSKAGILGRWAARAVAAECVVHSIHGFGHQPAVMRAPVVRTLRCAEQLTSAITSGYTADSAANIERGRQEKIIRQQPTAVVRCGIDVERFAAASHDPLALRRELQIPPEHQVVLQVGCLKPQKNPLAFVDLAADLRSQHPDATFLLAGDGALRRQLEKRCKALDLHQTVRLLGWRHDIPALLALCDVLVLTSLWEGLPQVFPQAMAAGKPIVATCVDGAPEAVVHGENGFLVPARNAPALAAAVHQLLGDSTLRRRFGAAGRGKAAAFSQQTMVHALDGFYAALVQGDS